MYNLPTAYKDNIINNAYLFLMTYEQNLSNFYFK